MQDGPRSIRSRRRKVAGLTSPPVRRDRHMLAERRTGCGKWGRRKFRAWKGQRKTREVVATSQGSPPDRPFPLAGEGGSRSETDGVARSASLDVNGGTDRAATPSDRLRRPPSPASGEGKTYGVSVSTPASVPMMASSARSRKRPCSTTPVTSFRSSASRAGSWMTPHFAS